MSHGNSHDINYWPGYVDALINIVLNLLFLVGVFTIGLVCLNVQAIAAEKKALAAKAHRLLAAAQDLEQQETVRAALLALKPEPHTTPAKIKILETEITFRANVFKNAAPENHENGHSDSAGNTTDKKPRSAEQIAQMLVKGRLLAQHSFELNQYQIERAESLAFLGNLPATPDTSTWVLLVVSDPQNARAAREAFARLIATRSAMAASGIAVEKIQIRIAPIPERVTPPAHLSRVVFVFNIDH